MTLGLGYLQVEPMDLEVEGCGELLDGAQTPLSGRGRVNRRGAAWGHGFMI